MRIQTTDEDSGKRLDVIVQSRLPELSRAFIKKLCDTGKITVNGRSEKAGYKIRGEHTVEIDYDPDELTQIPDIDLPVLYEDEDCVVIDKPAGLLTHSKGIFNPEPTVATWLRSRVKNLGGDRAGIVHRLDRATSGVMICAKNSDALSWLQKQFSQRKVNKSYIAVISSSMEPEIAIIDMPIERNPKAPATFRVGANGKPATTEYAVEIVGQSYSLIKLMPKTGRTHQLRVHLAHMHHPIVGDSLYGGEPADRLYLHALSLEITLPNRNRQIFIAKLPQEFEQKVESKE